MMAMAIDLHLLIVIVCVFLASLSSLLFINRFFRRKTFEEVIAEQKALTDKIYNRDRTVLKRKDQSKKQLAKKELKRVKKQQKKEQQQQQQQEKNRQELEHNDNHELLEDEDFEHHHLSSENGDHSGDRQEIPELFVPLKSTQSQTSIQRQQLNSELVHNGSTEKDNVSVGSGKGIKAPGKKEKKILNGGGPRNVSDEVFNKTDQQQSSVDSAKVVLTESIETTDALKHENDETVLKESSSIVVGTANLKNKKEDQKDLITSMVKKDKINITANNKKLEQNSFAIMENDDLEGMANNFLNNVKLESKEEKQRYNSPKNGNVKHKQQSQQQHNKKQHKDNSKGMTLIGEHMLNDKDTVSVSLLMNLFRRAELNRSEIQVLIDYLLNLQQDTPTNHAEWSDDICLKLKRQLKDAEKALAEEQEASLGIQAKLRELRAEVNAERITMSANVKNYMEKIQTKDQDLAILEQKLKSLNDSMNLERQQFQAKLIQEKQTASQDLLTQLQMMQNELTLKDKCISELTHIVNASRQSVEKSQQKDEIIQNQVQQLRALEQQRDEIEQLSNSRLFELEKLKQIENELNEANVEIRNIQNALDTNKAEANQSRMEVEALSKELATVRKKALAEKQQDLELLQSTNNDLQQKVYTLTTKVQDQGKEMSDLQSTLKSQQQQLHDKEQQLSELMTTRNRMQQELMNAQTNKREQDTHQQEVQELVVRLREEVDVSAQQLHDNQALIENLNHELEKQRQTLRENAAQLLENNELQSRLLLLQEQQWEKDQRLEELQDQVLLLQREHQELTNQLQEQKDKNNELRKKNWKLVEALDSKTDNRHVNRNLQNRFECQTSSASQEPVVYGNSGQILADVNKAEMDKTKQELEQIITEEKYLKELCARLYPDAINMLPAVDNNNIGDWMERVLNLIIELEMQKQKLVSKDNTDNMKKSNLNKPLNAAPTTITIATGAPGLNSDKADNNKESLKYLSDNSESHHNDSSSLTEVQVNSHHNNSNNISKISNNNVSNSNSNSNSDKKLEISSAEQSEKQIKSVGDHVDQQQQSLSDSLAQEEKLSSPALAQSNGEKDI